MNHFTMGQTLGTFHGPQISPPPITWGLSQQSTSSTFIEASTFYIIRGRWLCIYECSKHPGCYKVIQLTLGSDFQESHVVPSASVICCLLLCSDAWAGSLKEYQRCQQVPKCRRGCQEHPWKASSWPCTRPDKLLKLLWVSTPAWPTVRLCSSVRLSLAQPYPLCWVWKLGSGLLIQIKAVSWAVRAAVTKYHPRVPFKQQTWVPPGSGGWKFKIRQMPWLVRAVFSLCPQGLESSWQLEEVPFPCMCLSSDMTPWVLVRIITLIDRHRGTQKVAHTKSLIKDGRRWRWHWR